MNYVSNKYKLIFMILILAHIEVFSLDNLKQVYSPYRTTKNRMNFIELKNRTRDGFGAYRTAGHKHAGIDIIYTYNESVYAIGSGTIYAIYGEFPYSTVLIRHERNNGEIIYSAYTHIQDICVRVDQEVNEETCLGRAFSEDEYKKSEFYVNHLHFEIRKTVERYKGISIKCFSMEELNNYFIDPLVFFRNEME